jgi:hypothetical protein
VTAGPHILPAVAITRLQAYTDEIDSVETSTERHSVVTEASYSYGMEVLSGQLKMPVTMSSDNVIMLRITFW